LIHYATLLPFGVVFYAINLPFCWLPARRMGAASTLRTFCAVGLVSLFSDLPACFIHGNRVTPYYAPLFDSSMVGTGLVVLFRH
ncbi:YitT family protein, partial [Klebsiella quasipneumoniae]|uniref:YitT family protein n=1 Tax=Klebsiella quasipneumoniae TaxID=1463165 RepID=UPI002553FA93